MTIQEAMQRVGAAEVELKAAHLELKAAIASAYPGDAEAAPKRGRGRPRKVALEAPVVAPAVHASGRVTIIDEP